MSTIGGGRVWVLMWQIFPVTYVEALAEPTAAELQEEAQEEAKVFASLGELTYALRRSRAVI